MEQAIIDAGKYIGAGMACLGMGGAGIGLGSLFGNYLAGAIRNPAAAEPSPEDRHTTRSCPISRRHPESVLARICCCTKQRSDCSR